MIENCLNGLVNEINLNINISIYNFLYNKINFVLFKLFRFFLYLLNILPTYHDRKV